MEELEIKSKDTGCDSQIFSSELEYLRIIKLQAFMFCCNKIILALRRLVKVLVDDLADDRSLVFKIEKHLNTLKMGVSLCEMRSQNSKILPENLQTFRTGAPRNSLENSIPQLSFQVLSFQLVQEIFLPIC